MKTLPGILLLAGLLALLALPRHTRAEEPAQQFLEALLANNYHDFAEIYLEQMADSPLAPAEFKENLLYHQGNVLIQSARLQRDMGLRQTQLDRAQEKINQFIQQHPQNPLVPQATQQLAAIYYENALILVHRASSQVGRQQEATNEEAGQNYDRAIEVYLQRLTQIRTELEPLVSQQYDPQTQGDLIEYRRELQGDYLFTMIRIPELMFARAGLHKADSQERTEMLQQAAERFHEMAEKYRTLRVSYDAWFWHARCMQELGQLEDAINDYGVLLTATEDDPETRALKAQALYRSMQCWLDDSIKNYDEALTKSTGYWDTARPNEMNTPPWLALRYYLALASKSKADSDAELSGSEKRALLQQARMHAEAVSEQPGEYQQAAQLLLTELTGVEPDEEDDSEEDLREPTNFTEAKQFGDEATQAMQSAQRKVLVLEEQLASAQDEQNRAEMLEVKKAAEEDIISNRARAAYCYEMALQLADGETSIEDLNQVRFLLAYYLYTGERYYEAAVLGEFIARNFPDHGGALKSATIAMVCYQHLYKQASDEAKEVGEGGETTFDTQFAATHVLNIADYLATTWETQPEAQDALITLINFLVREGKLDQANEYLQRINPDGSKRGKAELILGRALWAQYKRGLQLRRDVEAGRLPEDQAPDLIKLEQMKQLAEESLAAGIARMREQNTVDATLADAQLALTEIYVDTGQPAKALPLLEDENIGLLALLQQQHDSVQRQGVASAVYLAALRAYIAVVPEQDEAGKVAMMRNASLIMRELKRASPNPRQLTPLYLSLARDIKVQLDLIDEAEKKAAMAEAFEAFLAQVAENSQNTEELIWAADSLLNVGQSFDTDITVPPPEVAMRLYEESVRQFNRILDMGKSGQLQIPPGTELQIRVRLANALRSMRRFYEAMNEYETILRSKSYLQIQVEAAEAYEDWVASGVGLTRLWKVAVGGGRWDNAMQRYVFWGWSGIAAQTEQSLDQRETFYQARLHWAECNLEYALAEPAKRDEYLNLARGTLLATNEEYLEPALSAHGDLTNDQIKEREYAQAARPRYNELMRRVQRTLGEEPTGLPALP